MSSTQNNADLEEGLSPSTPSSMPNATAGSCFTASLAQTDYPQTVDFSSANATAGKDNAGGDLIEDLDLEDGLATSPPAMQNVAGSSPFTLALAQTDNSSATASASNYAASGPPAAMAAATSAAATSAGPELADEGSGGVIEAMLDGGVVSSPASNTGASTHLQLSLLPTQGLSRTILTTDGNNNNYEDDEEGKKHRAIRSKNTAASSTLLKSPTKLTLPTPFNSTGFEDEEEGKKHQAICSKNTAASGTPLQAPTELMPPTPFNYTAFEDEEEGKKHRAICFKNIAASETLLQTPTELTPPTPFKYAMFEDEEEGKKRRAIGSDEDSIIYPTIEEMEDEVIFNINTSDEATAQSVNRGQLSSTTLPQVSKSSSRPSHAPQRTNDERRNQQERPPAEVTTGPPSPQPTLSPPIDEETPPSLPTLEATLVVENNEPTVPTYIPVYEATRISATKRYKNYIIVGLVSLVFGGMAAIIFFDVGNNDNSAAEEVVTKTVILWKSSPPSFSASPSLTPSFSQDPSTMPSHIPTTSSSSSPSESSSFFPSNHPSLSPSMSPTAQVQSSALELIPNEEIMPTGPKKSVAIYNGTAIVGAPNNDNLRGSVFVYVKDENGEWILQAKLVAPDRVVNDQSKVQFGWSVGLYGNYIIVGVPHDDDNGSSSGCAHIFVRNGVTWSYQTTLVAPDGAPDDYFGHNVGIHGDTAIVGANGDDDNGSSSGCAHVFVLNGVTWSHQAKLLAPYGAAMDHFGRSVGIHGDTVTVGAYDDDDNGSASGSAHVFVRNGVTWAHQTKLLAPYGAAGDRFGWSLGIHGNTIIVGAYGDDGNANNSGSADVFVRNGDTWSHQTKLVAPYGASQDYFGQSVAIYGDTVVVGMYGDNDIVSGSGSAYVFVRNGVTWTRHAKLVAPNYVEEFGRSVGIYDGTIIGRSTSGQAYVFSS